LWNIKSELAYISSNYGFLSETIIKLETPGQKLVKQIELVTTAIEALNSIKGSSVSNSILCKLNSVIAKNDRFEDLKFIATFLNGENSSNDTEKYTINEAVAFKFAPITLVEIERSFSMYKNILRSNRQSFLFDNLSQVFVFYCNQNI